MADSGAGTARSVAGGTGWRAMWLCTHSSGIGSGKWEHASEYLVQSDAQRVEIATGIHRAIHAPGLLGGHVGEGAGNDLGRRRRQALAGESGGDAKAGQPHVVGRHRPE